MTGKHLNSWNRNWGTVFTDFSSDIWSIQEQFRMAKDVQCCQHSPLFILIYWLIPSYGNWGIAVFVSPVVIWKTGLIARVLQARLEYTDFSTFLKLFLAYEKSNYMLFFSTYKRNITRFLVCFLPGFLLHIFILFVLNYLTLTLRFHL